MLGSSETIGGFQDLFATIDNKWKLYQRHDSQGAITAVDISSALLSLEGRTHKGNAKPQAELGASMAEKT